ncbi:hypothetical protein [cf. Phormidesmis sp. LEGE 11477]|uniref:hypothetical protein n=1 Tax=cf. Phormidesmis sp. LEGE 11477 TaxID=1828680 RepID=UPI001880D866|nr:hypothetical protein [cf. Phormidesmis sp. LEGE 11477]MBE9063429.1 hypothetical protein [cf. Phormidesmis sp. LEGE 11477]
MLSVFLVFGKAAIAHIRLLSLVRPRSAREKRSLLPAVVDHKWCLEEQRNLLPC